MRESKDASATIEVADSKSDKSGVSGGIETTAGASDLNRELSKSSKNRLAKNNNFVQQVLPYLSNSVSRHTREELLNVLIMCFLKSKSIYEFDSFVVLKTLIRMLEDPKERIRFTALEAIVAFVSIGNKLSSKEVIYQLSSAATNELIAERLEASPDMNPYLNENGALELPYLEHIELAASQL